MNNSQAICFHFASSKAILHRHIQSPFDSQAFSQIRRPLSSASSHCSEAERFALVADYHSKTGSLIFKTSRIDIHLEISCLWGFLVMNQRAARK
ncbi:unnamed protein product [Linum tenue]|uniref:Uncharacterized protein n=1 Tax=Linum tenue TaxID=586396 RepID=A0AAV0HD58_9ROSI|nr:unnamed protein product [Linum tenue]